VITLARDRGIAGDGVTRPGDVYGLSSRGRDPGDVPGVGVRVSRRGNWDIAATARERGWTVGVEHSEADWRADMHVENGRTRLAFEVQWSRQSLEDMEARQHRYTGACVARCWLIRHVPPGLREGFGGKPEVGGRTDLPAFRVVRTRTSMRTGEVTRETVYGITSLPPARADAAFVLDRLRAHWTIENGSHHVRDITFAEDHSQVGDPPGGGSIHQVMAAVRNTAIGLLRIHGEPNIAAACRRLAAHPWQALALLGIPTPTSE